MRDNDFDSKNYFHDYFEQNKFSFSIDKKNYGAMKCVYFTPTQHGQSRFSRFVAIHEQERTTIIKMPLT